MNEFQQRIGVGQRSSAFAVSGETRVRKVIADDGPRRGTVVGTETDHKSGRQDANVYAPAVHITLPAQRKEGTQ